MLSTFPELFTFGLAAPFVLRVLLGCFFIFQGLRRHKQDAVAWNALWNDAHIGSLKLAPILTKIQVILGVLLFVGLYTQISAIIAILFIAAVWYRTFGFSRPSFTDAWISLFPAVIAFSLLFLGAGLLAFDLPL
jgi:uncharacterized membrane protein YphA (DoxX/SURF4 family)